MKSKLSRPRTTITGSLLLFSFLAIYHLNGTFPSVGDSTPNVFQAAGMLRHGTLHFSPYHSPSVFVWRLIDDQGRPYDLRFWDWEAPAVQALLQQAPGMFERFADLDPGTTWADLYAQGSLELQARKYFLIPSAQDPGTYVNQFGPGAAIAGFRRSVALLRKPGHGPRAPVG